MIYTTFEELDVWKLARQLKMDIKKSVKSFPPDEKFRLTDQLIRSSRSVGANISEGFGRFHFKENIKFCFNARGSLMETLNHIIDAYDECYINETDLDELRQKILKLQKVLNGYIFYLKNQSQ